MNETDKWIARFILLRQEFINAKDELLSVLGNFCDKKNNRAIIRATVLRENMSNIDLLEFKLSDEDFEEMFKKAKELNLYCDEKREL